MWTNEWTNGPKMSEWTRVLLHRGRGSTTAMQEYVGAPKAQKAENVASDDIVFKRYINNERKKKPRK